jgi:type IV secretion system protein TrbG
MRFHAKFSLIVLLACPAFGQAHKAKTDRPDLPLQLSREAPLPANTREALALSQASLDADPQAKAAPDGRVLLTYGAGTPTLICALLKVTEIDLEPGETVVKDGVDVGDSPEFHAVVRHAGSGPTGYDYLVLKPTGANVETTMTVGTDRRVYYFRLRATENQFISRVAFAYPQNEAAARAKALKEQSLARALVKPDSAPHMAEIAPTPAFKPWKYSIKKKGRDADYLVPVSVGDDGAHTQIQLTQEARMRGLPVLQIRDATGPIPANTHWEEHNKLIVDAIFEDGCLLEGVGRKQQRVCIHNESLHGHAGSEKETSHDTH